MRTVASILVLAVLAVATSHAVADKRKKRRTPTPKPAVDEPPQPGTCRHRQVGGTVKDCWLEGNTAEFKVTLSASSQLRIVADVPIRSAALSDKRFVTQTEVKGTNGRRGYVIYILKAQYIGKDVRATLTTDRSVITLHFSQVEENADSLVSIVHLDKETVDENLDRARRLCEQKLEAAEAKRDRVLGKEIDAKARDLMHGAVFTGGTSIREAGGTRHARNDHLAIHTGKVYRMGKFRYLYLEVSVDNRGGDRALLSPESSFSVWKARGGKRGMALAVSTKCSRRKLRPGGSARCVVALTLPDGFDSKDRLQVRVKESRGDRSVTLRGVDVR